MKLGHIYYNSSDETFVIYSIDHEGMLLIAEAIELAKKEIKGSELQDYYKTLSRLYSALEEEQTELTKREQDAVEDEKVTDNEAPTNSITSNGGIFNDII